MTAQLMLLEKEVTESIQHSQALTTALESHTFLPSTVDAHLDQLMLKIVGIETLLKNMD